MNKTIKEIENKGKVNEIYNVAGGFEQENRDTVKAIIKAFNGTDKNWQEYVDFGYKRLGQDVRYALNDDKLRSLGWKPVTIFYKELPDIVEYYKNNFIW